MSVATLVRGLSEEEAKDALEALVDALLAGQDHWEVLRDYGLDPEMYDESYGF